MNKKKKSLLDNKLFLLGIAFLMALVSWIAVVMTKSPDKTVTIYNVPVTIPSSGTSYQALGLDIIGTDYQKYTVNITVEGDRNIVGSLTKSSFNVTPNFASVNKEGSYELPITVTKSTQLLNFEIKNVSPASVELTFATVTERTYKVETVLENQISVDDGYLVGTITALPAEVTVTGSAADLDRIAKVAARVTSVKKLSETVTIECEPELLDENGDRLDEDPYKLDAAEISVTIPLYKSGTLKLDVGFINMPDSFDASTLNYTLSHSELRVAASPNIIDALPVKTIGYIDLSNFVFGSTYTFDISLSTGVVNLDNITSVTVTFPEGSLATKKLNISNIVLENGTEQYKYELLTGRLNNVTVIAPSDVIDSIAANSVVAVVDLSSVSLEKGQNTVPVEFRIPAYDNAFVAGTYTVLLEVLPG